MRCASVIGHFRVTFCLCFKTRPSAKPFIYENEFFSQVHSNANQTHFHMKGFPLGIVLRQRQKATRKLTIREENWANITQNCTSSSCNFICLGYTQQNFDANVSSSYSAIQLGSLFSNLYFAQTFTHVCVAFLVFSFFAFSLSNSTTFWFEKANRLAAIFFLLFQLEPPCCFHRNRICVALYNSVLHFLNMHSSLTTQNLEIVLSIL